MKNLLAIGLLLILAGSASAAIQVGDKWVYAGQTAYAQGNGGEFKFLTYKPISQTPDPTDFLANSTTVYSFCAQVSEYIAQPMYIVKIVDNKNSSGNQLSDFGEWLIWAYSTTWEGNDVIQIKEKRDTWTAPNLDTKLTGGAIQWAIWTDMGYNPSFDMNPDQQAWLADLHEQYVLDSLPVGDWYCQKQILDGKDPTSIAWMSPTPGGQPSAQDQLVLIPCGLYDVPEPASIVIWAAIGGLGTVLVGRKLRKNQIMQ